MMHREVAASVGTVVVAMNAEPERAFGSVTMSEVGGAVTMQRKLHGKRCRDVGEGLALIVALAIDPLADPSVPALPEPERLVAPPPPAWTIATPSPPRAHERPSEPVAPPPSRGSFHVAPLAGARVTWGLEPVSAAEIVVGMEIGLTRDRWAPTARIEGGPIASASIVAGDGTVVFSGGEINTVACPAAITFGSAFALVLAVCLSGGVAIVSTRSIGYAVPHDTTAAIGFLGPALRARLRVAGPIGVVLEGGVRAALGSFDWEVQGYGSIGATAPIAGTTALGVDVWLP